MSVVVYRQVSQEQLRLKTEVSCRSECFIWSLNIINQRYPIRKETKLLLVDWVVAYIQAFLMMMESLTTYCSCTISYYPRLLDCCLLLAYCVATGTLCTLYFIGLPGEDQKRFLMSLPCLKTSFFEFLPVESYLASTTNCDPRFKAALALPCRPNLEVKKKSPLIGAGEL